MKAFKLKFVKFEKALAFQVLEQSVEKEGVLFEKDGFRIFIKSTPQINYNLLFLRGCNEQDDLGVDVSTFESNEARDEYLAKVFDTCKAYAATFKTEDKSVVRWTDPNYRVYEVEGHFKFTIARFNESSYYLYSDYCKEIEDFKSSNGFKIYHRDTDNIEHNYITMGADPERGNLFLCGKYHDYFGCIEYVVKEYAEKHAVAHEANIQWSGDVVTVEV